MYQRKITGPKLDDAMEVFNDTLTEIKEMKSRKMESIAQFNRDIIITKK